MSDAQLITYMDMMPAGDLMKVSDRFGDMGIFNGGDIRVETAFAVSAACANLTEAGIFLNFLFCNEQGIMALGTEFGTPLCRIAKSVPLDDSVYFDVINGLSNGDYMQKKPPSY